MNSAVQKLLCEIQDVPGSVIPNSILRDGGTIVHDETGVVLISDCRELICPLGTPDPDTLKRAFVHGVSGAEIAVLPELREQVAAILGNEGEEAHLHELTNGAPAVLRDPNIEVRCIDRLPDDFPDPIVADELSEPFMEGQPVSATLVDDYPVSFCHAVVESDRYWDVSIDTLEGHRRRGYAAQAFLHHYEVMKKEGLDSVWGCVLSNVASRKLALRLGFRKVSAIWIFELE